MADSAIAPATTGDGYEFNASENEVVARTARYARGWGIVSIVIGAFGILGSLQALGGNAAALAQLPPGVANVVIGGFFISTARSLRSVVTTQGDDIAHLIEALRKLGLAFLIQLVVFALAFALFLVIVIATSEGAAVV